MLTASANWGSVCKVHSTLQVNQEKGGKKREEESPTPKPWGQLQPCRLSDPMTQLLQKKHGGFLPHQNHPEKINPFSLLKCLKWKHIYRETTLLSACPCLSLSCTVSLHQGLWQWAFATHQLSIWADCPKPIQNYGPSILRGVFQHRASNISQSTWEPWAAIVLNPAPLAESCRWCL